MASLHERRPGVWELVVPAGFDPVAKRYRQVSRTFHGGKRDAQKKLAELTVEVSRGRHQGSAATVNDLMDRWLPELERLGRSPNTIHGYRQKVDRHIRPALGKIKVARLRATALNDLYGEMRTAGAAPRTIRQVHAILSSALTEAVRWEWVAFNPAKNARAPQVEHADPLPPTPGEVMALIDAAEAKDPMMGRLFFVAATTGMRRAELCGLRWPDLDGSVLRVSRSVVDVPEARLQEKGTKNRKTREFGLDPATVGVLAVQREAMAARAELAGSQLAGDGFVWSDALDGTVPWRPDRVTLFFTRLRGPLGLEHLRFHQIRHFMVTSALDAGVPVATVARRGGHDPAVMLRVYAHWMEAADRQASDAVSALLAGDPEP